MEALVLLWGGLALFLILAAGLERLGWLEDPDRCSCEACIRARHRDWSRGWD